ncbi:hypothetical protein CC85DRAFT_282069 [Cutaneotrichosporon oleaginosum]|uniref:Uncharacterized protein n=1 Tax=Cutaneotrichosporon oleaginosum TaxID=879819 RepID=A0A0J0XY08_9TREE|nr:uncharacterized protein CC85DRAFT_282069 [Cutaneotrichosporon oleaginosum]KLT45926.1 hypothetical protein CC85DRAFT_282069 [Cutaneotrichosporon oleaginosum]TXT06623.1 hypothetical protein COLE_05954 [Cutaneotrichosporon oleaginosum]
MRDAAHDIKQTISALPSREEVKEDQAESLIQPLAQVQADMNKSIKEMLQDSQHDLLKQLVEQQRKQVEEQLQPIKEELAQMRATLAKPPSNPAPRTDKTTQALQGALIASLRSVDELKDALLPLNLEKTLPQVFGLANHLNVVHNKIDHVTVNTRGLPAVQQVQQSILERIVQVHARTASQELTGQKQIELSVKFGDKLSSLEADSLANAQALNAIGKEVEKQAEAARDAALRRQNAVDQSTQTNTPSIYANVNKQGGVDGLQHGHTLALESPVSSNSRFPPAFVDSPSAVEDLFDSRFPSSQGTSRSPQCSSTIVEDPQTVAPPVQLPIPRPVGPVKIKLRRRAPANKVTTPLIQEAPALNSPSKADDEAASDPSSSSLIPFGAASDPPSKKRKSPKPSEVPTSTMAAPRRTTRQRKTPVRWGQTPAPDGDDYIVLGTQPPTRPCRPIAPLPKKSKGKRKGKGKPKMIEPKVEVEDPLASTGLLIDLSTDSTYDNGDNGDESGLSIPSTTADSSTLHPSLSSIQSDPLPASHPSVVMETCLPASSAIEPLHITRSATSNLDGLTRQAFLAAPDERVESDGEATEEDDDQNPEG